jgi:hypothetical protein
MSKSGLADSPFFAPAPHKNEAVEVPLPAPKTTTEENLRITTPAPPPEQSPEQESKETNKRKLENTKLIDQSSSGNNDAMEATMQPRINASKHASMHALINESLVETIRRAVKDVGKDSATYRFTPEEKKALLELSFSYKMQGFKTSENELVRIAINFILEDHKQNGRNSVLQKVLDALDK